MANFSDMLSKAKAMQEKMKEGRLLTQAEKERNKTIKESRKG